MSAKRDVHLHAVLLALASGHRYLPRGDVGCVPADLSEYFLMSLSAESTGDGAAADSSTSSRSSLQLVLLAWVFGAGWMWTINGAAMTRFARLLETPDWAFGCWLRCRMRARWCSCR